MLCKYQSGFRSISSTVTALREATYVRAYNKNIGKIIAVISLDLKNAFDIVDHIILLSKLDPNGTSGKSLKWLQSYLENRTQQCSVSGSLSDSRVLTCDVPRGTILYPLLFLFDRNDLPHFFCQTVNRGWIPLLHPHQSQWKVLGWNRFQLRNQWV